MDRRILFAVLSIAVSAGLTAVGTFSGDEDHAGRTYLVVLAVILVAAGVLYWIVVPRFAGGTGMAALVVAVLGFVSLALFWLGLPAVFAGAATLLALDARERRDTRPTVTLAALIISAAVVVLATVLAFAG